jgi:adenine-specific DNA-methyltransferase
MSSKLLKPSRILSPVPTRKSESQAELFPSSGLPRFPSTRYQGSKRKILGELAAAFGSIDFDTVLDLYSGSASVSLLLRYLGKKVHANDFQQYNQATARLFLGLTNGELNSFSFVDELSSLLYTGDNDHLDFVNRNYAGVFFKESENVEIDRFCQNLAKSNFSDLEKDAFRYAVGQALMKKRPYNLFHRANLEMRTKDVKRSFGNAATWETSILDHAVKAIEEIKGFPFGDVWSGAEAFRENTCDLGSFKEEYDLIYMDPPYLNGRGAGVDYSDFYSFLEGLCDYGLFGTGDVSYPHKPILRKKSRWSKTTTALDELSDVCAKWRNSVIFMSYRSDGLPTPAEVGEVLSSKGRRLEVHSCGEYKYALSGTNTNEELFLISFP